MTTFSQLIDEMVAEHLRPDLRIAITSYANQTIRELHSRKGNSEPILFGENRNEVEFTFPSAPAIWPIPSTTRFQRLETAYSPVRGVYYVERSLSRVYKENENPFCWYRSGPNFVFSMAEASEVMKISYFMFPRFLTYYATADRPATWDAESETFSYHADYTATAELQAEAESLTTNWILLRWGEAVVKQGIRAKVFSRLGDGDRARMSYSAFESMREQMNASEEWQQNAL